MGKHDSTKTRVTPVFADLVARDPSGTSWLLDLLALPTGLDASAAPVATPPLVSPPRFGDDEVSLDPPRTLLRWMVEHPERLRPPKSAAKQAETTRTLRRALLDPDDPRHAEVRSQALHLIDHGPLAQQWYVFEGRSRHDVFLETADAIVVIEGKRTEPGRTKKVSWLHGRDQMLRHLDAAYEHRRARHLYGFLIVEGDKRAGCPGTGATPHGRSSRRR